MYRIAPEERKNRVLKAIIDEYSMHGIPVASNRIVCKIQYSPATIRHIMVELEEIGYLKKVHFSAGRIPTDEGYRFYVERLMEPELLTKDEKDEIERLLRKKSTDLLNEISFFLAKIFQLLSIVLSTDEKIFIKGRGNILALPEFSNIKRSRKIFEFLEREEEVFTLLSKGREKGKVCVLIGKENEWNAIKDCSVAMASYIGEGGKIGVLSVIGPTRMKYFKIIPTVEFISKRLSKVLGGKEWVEGRKSIKQRKN